MIGIIAAKWILAKRHWPQLNRAVADILLRFRRQRYNKEGAQLSLRDWLERLRSLSLWGVGRCRIKCGYCKCSIYCSQFVLWVSAVRLGDGSSLFWAQSFSLHRSTAMNSTKNNSDAIWLNSLMSLTIHSTQIGSSVNTLLLYYYTSIIFLLEYPI